MRCKTCKIDFKLSGTLTSLKCTFFLHLLLSIELPPYLISLHELLELGSTIHRFWVLETTGPPLKFVDLVIVEGNKASEGMSGDWSRRVNSVCDRRRREVDRRW